MDADLVLVEALARAHPEDVARLLELGDEADAAELLTELDTEQAAAVASEMVPALAARRLRQLEVKAACAIVTGLSLDSAAALLYRLEQAEREPLLLALPKGPRSRSLRELLKHDPETAGALMDPLALVVPRDISVGEALERVRAEPVNALYYIYVIGPGGQLEGAVNQRELMLAPADAAVSSIMATNLEKLSSAASRLAIVTHPGWQRVHALPVVDAHGTFLGAIRYKTVRRLERELGRATRSPAPEIAAGALAELFGLAAAGMGEWALSTVRGPARGNGEES